MKKIICSLLAFALPLSCAPSSFAGPLASSAKAPARGYSVPRALLRLPSGQSAALVLPRSPSLALGLPVLFPSASPSGAARAFASSPARVSAAAAAQLAAPSAASAASRVVAIGVQVRQVLESLPVRRGAESDRALGEDLQRRLSGERVRLGSALERAVDGAPGEDAGAPKVRGNLDTFRYMRIDALRRIEDGRTIILEGSLDRSYTAAMRSEGDGKPFYVSLKLWNAPAEAERVVKPEELDGLDAALKRFIEENSPSEETAGSARELRARIALLRLTREGPGAASFGDGVARLAAKPDEAPAKQARGEAKKPVRPEMGEAAIIFYLISGIIGAIAISGLAAQLGFAAAMAGLCVFSTVALFIAAFAEFDKERIVPEVPQGEGVLVLVALPILNLIVLGGALLLASPLASFGALLGGLDLLDAYLLYRWFFRACRRDGPVYRLAPVTAGMGALFSVAALFGPVSPGFLIFQALAALVLYASARK